MADVVGNLAVPLEIPLLIKTDTREVSGYTSHYSYDQLEIMATAPLRLGTALALQFTFGDVCHLDLTGIVAYCLPTTCRGKRHFAIGIKFTSLRPWERQILPSAIQEVHRSEDTARRSFLHVSVPRTKVIPEGASLQEDIAQDEQRNLEREEPPEERPARVTAKDLLPKLKRTSYSTSAAKTRREWLSNRSGADLQHIGVYTENPDNLRGNIEHFIGSAQIPIGIAGPLRVNGQHARGTFYIPMATTEGALTYTCNESMLLISLSGGANTAILDDQLHISPIFIFDTVKATQRFAVWIAANFATIKQYAETATRHGKLLAVEPQIFDKNVVVKFTYWTADAMGINMVTFATEEACKYIIKMTKPRRFYLQPNFSSIKKVTSHNFVMGFGKTVVAEAVIPAGLVKRTFNVTPQAIVDFYHTVRLCTAHVGMMGINGHTANMLAAIFTACGQDIACVVDSYVGVTNFEVTEDYGLYVSLKLPSLLVGTVGGGTSLVTQRECLELLGCYGPGKARKFAEIVAAATLAGEIGICARVANGTFANAHKKYGRKPGLSSHDTGSDADLEAESDSGQST